MGLIIATLMVASVVLAGTYLVLEFARWLKDIDQAGR